MSEAVSKVKVRIWTDGPGTALTARVIAKIGDTINVTAVGGSDVSEVAALARQNSCEPENDLRRLLLDDPSAVILLAAIGELRIQDLADSLYAGATILTLEPPLATLDDLAVLESRGSGLSPSPLARLSFAPSFTSSPGWRSAADPVEVLGTLGSMAMVGLGPPGASSLFARLFDAWCTALRFIELPLSIDASWAGSQASPPSDLRQLSGHLGVLARAPTGCPVVMHLCDRAATAIRQLTLLGDAACGRISDLDYELVDPAGILIDRSPPDDAHRTVDVADLIARQWTDLLYRQSPATTSGTWTISQWRQALACCHACLLSARTGEPESPGNLLEINR